MAEPPKKDDKPAAAADISTGTRQRMGMRLAPVNNSDQPVCANLEGSRTKRSALFAMAFAVTIYLTGCSLSTKEVTWKEEVRLTNGAIIFIERTQIYRRVSEPGAGSGWLFDHAKLTAQMPQRTASVTWEGSVQPLVLDLDEKGIIYLLGTVEGYRGRRAYDVVEGTKYVRFRFENGEWGRISLDQFPREFKPNLLASVHELFRDDKKHSVAQVDIALKTQLDSRRTLSESYRSFIDLK